MYLSRALKLARYGSLSSSRTTLTSSIARQAKKSVASQPQWSSLYEPESRVYYHSTSTTLKSADPLPVEEDESWRSHPSAIKLKFREQLEDLRARAQVGGGEKRIAKQHTRGRLTARERLDLLFDPGTFRELDQLKAHRCTEFGMDDPKKQFPGDGIVTGHGMVNGRVVYAFSQGMYLM